MKAQRLTKHTVYYLFNTYQDPLKKKKKREREKTFIWEVVCPCFHYKVTHIRTVSHECVQKIIKWLLINLFEQYIVNIRVYSFC